MEAGARPSDLQHASLSNLNRRPDRIGNHTYQRHRAVAIWGQRQGLQPRVAYTIKIKSDFYQLKDQVLGKIVKTCLQLKHESIQHIWIDRTSQALVLQRDKSPLLHGFSGRNANHAPIQSITASRKAKRRWINTLVLATTLHTIPTNTASQRYSTPASRRATRTTLQIHRLCRGYLRLRRGRQANSTTGNSVAFDYG